MGIDSESFSKMIDDYGKRCPVGRGGEPRDVCSAVMFLASEDASWVTGINMVIDGGALHSPGVNSIE